MTSSSRIASAPAIYAALAAGALITLAPFALGLMTSFTSAEQFNTQAPLSWPNPPTLENYTGLADAGFGRALVVTYHPAAAIRFGPRGAPVAALRSDLAMVARLLTRPVPA